MAKIVARNVKIISAGKDLSGQYNNSVLTLSAEAPEVTSYGNDSRQRLAGGIRDVELTIDGFYNDSASSTDATFRELTAAGINYFLSTWLYGLHASLSVGWDCYAI